MNQELSARHETSPRRRNARATGRQEIARAVARLAAQRGIDALSLRAIATEANTSMGNIQYQFGPIADVVLFALSQSIDEIETLLNTVDDQAGQARLRGIAETLLAEDADTMTTIRAYAQLRTSAGRDARAAELLAAFQDRRVSEFEAILVRARTDRLLHSMVDPRHEADVFWTLMLAVAIEVAQGIRPRAQGLDTLRYHFLRLARNKRVTRPPRR